MYNFVYCQTSPSCPNVVGWYLVLEPDDFETLMKLHRGVTALYYGKFGCDPHYAKPEFAYLYNPIRLAATWLASIEGHLLKWTLLVNSKGGFLPFDDAVRVITRERDDKLIWPDRYENEVITISRWPEGAHYYLISNRNRVFVPEKWPTYEDAYEVAKRYTENIK